MNMIGQILFESQDQLESLSLALCTQRIGDEVPAEIYEFLMTHVTLDRPRLRRLNLAGN